MYIDRVLSLNNGWTILNNEKNNELDDINKALRAITKETLIEALDKENENSDQKVTFLLFFMFNAFNQLMRDKFQWNDVLPKINKSILGSLSLPSVKNNVAASFTGLEEFTGGDIINNLYLKAAYYHNNGLIQVNIVIMPTSSTSQFFYDIGAKSDDVMSFISEEACREQLAKFRFIPNHAPIVLAFFSIEPPEQIYIEEYLLPSVSDNIIERIIEFAPEYYQAGVSLLSYFGQILRQKDPNTTAKVRIEQDGTTVRLHIESASGEIETIEKELEKFALVISEQIPPESIFENRAHVIQLENKLAMTKLELKHEQDMRQLTDGLHSQRINSLEQQLAALQQQLSSQLLQQGQIIQLTAQQASSNERIQTALLTHSQDLFTNMLQEASGNQLLAEAVHTLQRNLLSSIAAVDMEDQLERALSTIQQEKPGFLSRMLTEFKGAAYKASATSAFTWVTKWISAHPTLH